MAARSDVDRDPAAASQDEWVRTRRYLSERRRELTQAAQALYPPELRVAGTPLLARPEWLPDEPVPLNAVALDLRERPDVSASMPEAGHSLPLRPDGTRYPTYAAAMAELSRPKLFENRVCYRLLDADGPSLSFGVGHYFDLINTCEAVAHEYAAAKLDGTDRRLPLRTRIGDPADLTRRPVMAAITTLVLTPDTGGASGARARAPGGTGAKMILHRRDPAKVATGGGLYTTAPVGMFQPSHDAPWNLRNDFGLWRSLVRELNEELLGGGEEYGSDQAPIDYPRWPVYQRLTSDVRTVCWLGMGVDPLSLVLDMLVVAAFDTLPGPQRRGRRPRPIKHRNDEGRLITAGFTEQYISRLTNDENVQPASAALLRLAWRHRDAIL